MTNSNKPHMTCPNGDVIHEGGYGVTRDGRKVGPMEFTCHKDGYPWLSNCGVCGFWSSDGQRQLEKYRKDTDIIAAWVEDTKPAKPAKDPNRPRPAHKLKLRNGDVVRFEGWDDGRPDPAIGSEITFGNGYNLDAYAEGKQPKGQRPLFVVVSRAKPPEPTDTRNRLVFAENAMLEDGMTPAQIRDHMRRYADVIDAKICGMEATP